MGSARSTERPSFANTLLKVGDPGLEDSPPPTDRNGEGRERLTESYCELSLRRENRGDLCSDSNPIKILRETHWHATNREKPHARDPNRLLQAAHRQEASALTSDAFPIKT